MRRIVLRSILGVLRFMEPRTCVSRAEGLGCRCQWGLSLEVEGVEGLGFEDEVTDFR